MRKAKSDPANKNFFLKSLKTINRKDGINQDEAILIAQHCLQKSPYAQKYALFNVKIEERKNQKENYKIHFTPKKDLTGDCSLFVSIDPKTSESLCECTQAGNDFSLKTGYLETEDKQQIHYNQYKNGHKKVLILVHGFYNSKEAVLFIKMAQDLSGEYDVIVFDMRGHGLSSGLFTWTTHSDKDLESVLEYASKQYEKIGVIGFSLGAATSIITTAKSDLVDSLISVSSPTEFSKIDGEFWTMGVEENIAYNVFGEGRIGKGVRPGFLWLKKTKPINVVDQIKVPILFVHGKKDWLINPWHSQELYAKAKSKKGLKLITEGTHAEYIYRRDSEGTIKIFKDWFKDTLND